jgi:glycosyltransferase involved in cell wall biosynthesis
MKISVIVPVYADWGRLTKCINLLDEQVFSQDDFEIIVVNNSSTDDVPVNLVLRSDVTIISEKKPGSYSARNTGAHIAKGAILAFTDSDCIPEKNWLSNADEWFQSTDCDLLGGKIEIFREPQGSEIIYRYERHTAFRQDKHVPEGKGVTANLFVRRDVFMEVGGFYADIKSGGDWEFTERCVEKGYEFRYAENVVVHHPARTSLRTLLRKQKRFVCWGMINVNRKFGHSRLRILMSSIYNGAGNLFRRGDLEVGLSERILIFLIDAIKLVYRVIIGFLILVGAINPYTVRE